MGGRLKAGLLLAAMFALGALSGIAWQNFQMERQGLPARYVARRLRWLKRQLRLTPSQEEALGKVIQDAHGRVTEIHQRLWSDLAEIHQDSVDSFREFLTPEQQKKFDAFHQKSHSNPVPPLEASGVEDSTS